MNGTVSKYQTAKGEVRYRWAWTEILPGGKRYQHSGKGFLTKAEASKALRKSLEPYDQGHKSSDESLTVEEWLELWLTDKQGSLEPSTFRSYRITVDRVIPYIGKKMLRGSECLSNNDILRMMRALRKSGSNRRNANQGLTEATINRTLTILSDAFESARVDGHCVNNPCGKKNGVRRNKVQTPIKAVWSAQELFAFLDARESADDRLAPLWRLLAATGLRRSEALGLKWRNVDLNNGRILVCERRVMVGHIMHERPGAKSDGSVRTIPIDTDTIAVLQEWKDLQEMERFLATAENRWTETGLVFTRADNGQGLHADRVGNRWATAVRQEKANGVVGISMTLHGLRHLHGSILIMDGVPIKTVSVRLGHADPGFTMRVYAHLLAGMEEQASNAFQRVRTANSAQKSAPESLN